MTEMRPQSIEQLKELMSRFRSSEALEAVSSFESEESDVFISTFAKSGTTWMQQVVHQLRSQVDDAYNDIYEVVPWFESAIDMGMDPSEKQRGNFRIFKTHLDYESLPKNRRYISILRNPLSVISSWYRFFDGWFFETGTIPIDEFARNLYFEAFSVHQSHIETWFKRKSQSDSLVLSYEDMVAEPERVPVVVADFLGLTIDDATMVDIVEHCSREYMHLNRSKFEENLFRKSLDKRLNLPPGGDSSKVNSSSDKVRLSGETIDELNALWRNTIGMSLGFHNYEQLRKSLPNLLNAPR